MALAATLFVSKRLTAVAAALLCLATVQLLVKAAPSSAPEGVSEVRVSISR